MSYTFQDLKKEFAEYDRASGHEQMLYFGSFMLDDKGCIYYSNTTYDIDRNVVSVYAKLSTGRTPEQMKAFINSLL